MDMEHRWVPVSIHHPRYQILQVNLTDLRKKSGLSQVELASRMGVGQSYVSKIERGEAYVDVLIFMDWCKACDVRAGVVLDKIFDTFSQSIQPILSDSSEN